MSHKHANVANEVQLRNENNIDGGDAMRQDRNGRSADAIVEMDDLKSAAVAKGSSASFMPKPKTPMQCSFTDVSCYVPAQLQVPGLVSTVKSLARKCAPKAAAAVQERQILHGVTGVVNPGEVVAIMGP